MDASVEKLLYVYCKFRGVVFEGTNDQLRELTVGVPITQHTIYDDFVNEASARASVSPIGLRFSYTVKFDQEELLPLNNTKDLMDLFTFNDSSARVYIDRPTIPQLACSQPTTSCQIVEHSSTPSQANSFIGPPPMGVGYMSRCAVGENVENISSTFQHALEGAGQTFASAEAFRNAVYKFSLAWGFEYTWVKNSPQQLNVKCGVHDCPWKVTVRPLSGTSIYKIVTFRNTHSHISQDLVSHVPKLSSKRGAVIIADTIRQSPGYPPRQIMKDMNRLYGVAPTYMQAYRASVKAKGLISGNPHDSYKLLPWMCERLKETDSGTIAEWTCEPDGTFSQLFVAYGCSVEGFLYGCRPIIVIDGTFLKGPFLGVLLSANAYDADDHMFPIAYAIVSSENYEDWFWFLQQLKRTIGNREVTIISDRHQSIIRSVGELFGTTNHSHCYVHLKENFSSQVTTHMPGGRKKEKENALQLLDAVAYARLEEDYNKAMTNLRRHCPEFSKWVEENGPSHWAISKFPNKRWDKITSNLAESFNAWVAAERKLHVFDFMNAHRHKLADMLLKHKKEIGKWKGPIGPKHEVVLKENISRGGGIPVRQVDETEFEIYLDHGSITVDLAEDVCTCKAWQMTGIPCEHACAAIKKIGGNVYDYVDECLLFHAQRLIYGRIMSAVNTHDMPSIESFDYVHLGSADASVTMLPPRTKRPAGRPRHKRVESNFTKKRVIHCSRCQQPGHYCSTCQNPNPS